MTENSRQVRRKREAAWASHIERSDRREYPNLIIEDNLQCKESRGAY